MDDGERTVRVEKRRVELHLEWRKGVVGGLVVVQNRG